MPVGGESAQGPKPPLVPMTPVRQKLLDALAIPIPKKRPSGPGPEEAMEEEAYDDALVEDKPAVKKLKPTKIVWGQAGLIPALALGAADDGNVRLCATGDDAAELHRAVIAAATKKAELLKKLTSKVPFEHRTFVDFVMATKEANTILKVHLEGSKDALQALLKNPSDEDALASIFGLVAGVAKSLVAAAERIKVPMKVVEMAWSSDLPLLVGKSPEERLKVALATVAHAEKIEVGGETSLSAEDERYLTTYVAKELPKAAPKGKASAPKGGGKDAPAGGRGQPHAGRGGRGGGYGGGAGRVAAACFNCGIPGHKAADCRGPPQRAPVPAYQNNSGQTVWPQMNRGFHGYQGMGPAPGNAPQQPPR